jgi:hypothetical protein
VTLSEGGRQVRLSASEDLLEAFSAPSLPLWGPSSQTDIIVVKGPSANYLRTEPDLTKVDNLASLPDC